MFLVEGKLELSRHERGYHLGLHFFISKENAS